MPDRADVPGQSVDTDCPVFVLSPQQERILSLAAQGYTNVETARAMSLSPRTVTNYLGLIRGKLGASNTTHAVAIALRLGLIEFNMG